MQHFTFALLSLAIPLHFKKIARLGTKSRPPENPSLLPKNRFKCLRRNLYLRGKNLRSNVP